MQTDCILYKRIPLFNSKIARRPLSYTRTVSEAGTREKVVLPLISERIKARTVFAVRTFLHIFPAPAQKPGMAAGSPVYMGSGSRLGSGWLGREGVSLGSGSVLSS